MITAVYRGLGIGFVGLAVIGALLPLLPSTPFLLLATGCFMRSSPHWNERLFRSPLFGPALRDWHTKGTVSPATKAIAIAMMGLAGGTTLASGSMPWVVNVCLVITMIVAIGIVIRLPSRQRKIRCLTKIRFDDGTSAINSSILWAAAQPKSKRPRSATRVYP